MCVGEGECSEKRAISPRISFILSSLSNVMYFEGFLEAMSVGNKYLLKPNIHSYTSVRLNEVHKSNYWKQEYFLSEC